MWLLGEGLRAAFSRQDQWVPHDEERLAADLFGWTQRVMSSPREGWDIGQSRRPPPAVPRTRRVCPTPQPALALMQDGLAPLRCPVLWLGSSEVGGQWVSMALAVGIDGLRRVLAIAPGSVREQGVADELLIDLASRELDTTDLLVITEGSRTLDGALTRVWGGRMRVAHCRAKLRREIVGHFPEASRDRWCQELDRVWSLPVEEAAAVLQDLEGGWSRECPGAAERLARSREQSLTVAGLEVTAPLKERLESAGTLRMAFKKALRWAPPGPALPALAVGVPAWLQRTRRLIGWRGLELLAYTLRNRSSEPKNNAAPQA